MGGKKANHLKQLLRKFGAVRNWQLLLVLVPLMFLTATLLRLDHLRMVELRDAVVEADEYGDEKGIANGLTALQQFVVSHVVVNVVERNGVQEVIFGTGPFYLEQQYLRAANAAISEAENEIYNDNNSYGNIYGVVSGICRPLAIANGWSWNSPGYLECWTSELAKYPASDNLSTAMVKLPSTELYRYDFASPIWAPTWSGWAILACIIILAIIIIRLVIWCILQIALAVAKKTT